MSDIRARMEAVLREHECSYHWGGPDWDCAAEGCNASGGFWEEYAAHVADVLAEQLGLTQEWGAMSQFRNGPESEPHQVHDVRIIADDQAAARRDAGIPTDVATRYVSQWVRADDETGGAR